MATVLATFLFVPAQVLAEQLTGCGRCVLGNYGLLGKPRLGSHAVQIDVLLDHISTSNLAYPIGIVTHVMDLEAIAVRYSWLHDGQRVCVAAERGSRLEWELWPDLTER